MNFLGHFYLSGKDPDLIIGNFLGDMVKGKQWQEFDQGIATGILLHRHIDTYTDNNPTSEEVVRFMRPRFGKWSPVALDLIWDHMLASEWSEWSDEPLDVFAARMYEVLKENDHKLTDRARNVLYYMSAHDWLAGYSTLDGIGFAFDGLSRRIAYSNTLEGGNQFIARNDDYLRAKFRIFFPEMLASCSKWLEERKSL